MPERLKYSIKDFQCCMTWYQVKKAFSELESGWKLPTSNELKTIFNSNTNIGNISEDGPSERNFWTANYFNINHSWSFKIRKWNECPPAFHMHGNLLLLIRNV